MIKTIMLAAALMLVPVAAMAQDKVCNSQEAVTVLLKAQNAVTSIADVIEEPALVEGFKDAIVDKLGASRQDLTFSKVVAFNIDMTIAANASFEGMYWITLYDANGCLMAGFPESIEEFKMLVEAAKGILVKE